MNPAIQLLTFTANLYHFVQVSFRELHSEISWPSSEKVEHLLMLFLAGLLVCGCLVLCLDIVADKIMRTIYNLFI